MFRGAVRADMAKILEVYARARDSWRKTATLQWGDNYPSPELLEEDIDTNRLFVYMINGRMQAVFAFVLGEDPTYQTIEDGQCSTTPCPMAHYTGWLRRARARAWAKQCGVVSGALREPARRYPRRQQGDAASAGSEALPAAASSMWRTARRALPTSGCP